MGSAARVWVKPGITASAPARSLFSQGPHQTCDALGHAVDAVANPQAERRDRLLVPAAAEVSLAREVAHDLAQARLHEAVDVLGVELQIRGIPLGAHQHLRETLVEARGLLRGNRGAAAERARVGPRRRDLLAQQAPVERERPVELPEGRVRPRLVVAAPELHDR